MSRQTSHSVLAASGSSAHRPELLGTMPVEYPKRFLTIVTAALADQPTRAVTQVPPTDVARTLLSTATGIKHDVGTRDEFRARMTTAIDLYCTR